MTNDNRILAGKVALVTGAARGIGFGVARRLAMAGASVVITDIAATCVDAAEELVSDGFSAEGIEANVGDSRAVAAMMERAVRSFGPVDILVNNAGILRATSPMETISEDEWDLVMNVNLKGAFHCTKAVLPSMKDRKAGKVVNVSSIAARSSSNFGGAHYTASKAALLGFTRHVARESAPYGINVNAIAPAGVDTQMVPDLSPESGIDAIIKKIPLGRLASVDEIAELVLFLTSDRSQYISGACIDINGGLLMI